MIPRQPRGVPAFVVSVILHVVIGAVLLRALTMPNGLASLFSERGQLAKVERIGFLALPRSDATPTEAAKAGGDNRPETGKPSAEPAPKIVAPPAELPALPVAPAIPAETKPQGGSGEAIGGGGPTRGVRPSYNDPRLWLPTGPVVSAPLQPQTRADSLHDLLADKIRMFNDSVALATGNPRAPGDWTYTDKNGGKWGIDQQYIRLGKFSIPTAVLGMLPLNAQANPVLMDRQRTMNLMSREIQEQSARVSRNDEFRAAVKALRERKDKERREAQARGETPPPPIPPVTARP